MDDLINISGRIIELNKELAERRANLEKFVKSKALYSKIVNYKKQLELTIAQLRAKETPATLIKLLAEAQCAEKLAEVEQVQIEIRAAFALIGATESELTGYQSIFKRLDER